VAFLPALAFFGATCARRAPTLAFFVALGSSAVGAGAVSAASAVEIMVFFSFGGISAITSITRFGDISKRKQIRVEQGDGTAMELQT
jgi:hypothetical protein